MRVNPLPQKLPERGDAATLVGTYYQVSGRYRHVARFPDGITDGREALRDGIARYHGRPLDVREEAWVRALSERDAGEQFLRVYAVYQADELVLELTASQFTAFRRAGGGTYTYSRARP